MHQPFQLCYNFIVESEITLIHGKSAYMINNWVKSYPRPQLVRREWMSLDGEWRFDAGRGSETINVPFCPESELSGIGRRIEPGQMMVYEREFSIPERWAGSRLILHFGAVDQTAEVFVDGKKAGSHEGGYLPFNIDITELIYSGPEEEEPEQEVPAEDSAYEEAGAAEEETDAAPEESAGETSGEKPVRESLDLDWSEGEPAALPPDNRFTLRVEAVDKLDRKYPWGKQKVKNGGMWYTPVSGIWQSVWLEPVPDEYITSLTVSCGADWAEIRAHGVSDARIVFLGDKYMMLNEECADGRSAFIRINIRDPHMWSPEDPYLYRFAIETDSDRVESYFTLRTLTIEEHGGHQRLCLNGKPYFFNGLLDQGYWQDGIYTPAGPEKFTGDILAMKSLGFNTLRKHIKIEPQQFYFECDRLGMVVFQDMVNNGSYSFVRDSALPSIGMQKRDDSRMNRNAESRRIFLDSMEETVRLLRSHPSVCYWTIFNEGWGQFEADAAYERLKALDSSRFIDSTSGWFWQHRSDVDSYHVYFKPVTIKAGKRPLVLSEFGGYACKLSEHCYNKDKTYGYKKCADEADLLGAMGKLYDKEVLPLIEKEGLSAAIYTQVSDVEDETNGILTYDREILKFKSYTGTGRIEILGNHTDHQGGRVLVAPTPHKIRAYVAENHSNVIKVISEGFDPFDVSLTDRSKFEKGTTAAIITGLLEGFVDLFGVFDGEGKGFDVHVKSEVPVGSGLSSSAAFEILIARIINDRYFGGKADAVQLAKIAMFAEREYYGKPCGMMDQLAISLGRMAMIDFNGKEPEIELIDFDLDAAGYETQIIMTESDHAELDDDYASVPDDMFRVAEVLGVSRLGDINEEQFRRQLPLLEKKVKAGELTLLQLNRAKHFFDENDRVLAGAVALKTGNVEKFMSCVMDSGLSSENLLQNVLPPGVTENSLSRTLKEYRAKPDTAAIKLEGGGFGGSVLVYRRKQAE